MLNISIWMFLGLKYFKCRYYRYLIYQIDIIFVYVKYWWGCVIIVMQLLLNADIWYLKYFSLLEIFLLHCWNVVQINKQFNNPHDTKTREQRERELERCREQAGPGQHTSPLLCHHKTSANTQHNSFTTTLPIIHIKIDIASLTLL